MAKNWWTNLIPGVGAFNFLSGLGNTASDLLSSIATGAEGIGQGLSDTILGTHYGQSALQREQYDYNRLLSQQSRDWQEMMYNKYESPQALMQQFRDAGLNPALMYGDASPSPSFSSDQASVGLGSAQHGNISLSDSLLVAQARNLNADSKKKESEIPLIQQEIENSKAKGDEIRQNVELLKENRLVKHEEFNRLLNENNFFVETWANRSDLIGADAAKARLEVKTFKERFENEMKNLEQSTYMLYTQGQLNDEQKKQVIEVTKNLQESFRIISKQADILERYGDAEQVVGLITQSLNAINGTLGSIVDIVTAGKRPTLNVKASKGSSSSYSNPGTGIHPNYGF